MENAHDNLKYKFGLIGKNIDYSFSRAYFSNKFKKEKLPYSYVNFDLEDIIQLEEILRQNLNLKGLNVTIPYKESVIPFLHGLDKIARKIGAVNTIKISRDKQLIGYNTDYLGFKLSLEPLLKPYHKNALILGYGGASKAIAYALNSLDINLDYVSRSQKPGTKFMYSDLTPGIMNSYQIIINCTPVGTYPNVNECPDIPYEGITENHICYDLVYNPEQTKFLICSEVQGAQTVNGLEMLQIQAEEAWNIWTSE